MKFLILFVCLIPALVHAQNLMAEAGAISSLTSSELAETINSVTSRHDSSFVDPGIGLETRIGLHLPFISIGALGLANWESSLIKYQPANQSVLASTSYSNTRRRLAYGPTFMVHYKEKFGIVGEYFIRVTDDYTYAKPKSENPFSDGDYLQGRGWGIGGRYELSRFYFQASFRRFTFYRGRMRGAAVDLPTSKYSKLDTSGAFVSVGIKL